MLEENKSLEYFIDPFKILINKIEEKNNDLLKLFRKGAAQIHSELISCFNECEMNNFYEEFIGKIKITIENKKLNLKEINKEKQANIKKEERDEFINYSKKYKSNFENIKNNNVKIFHKSIKSLLETKKYLAKYDDIFNEEDKINIGYGKFLIPQKII